LHFIWHKNAVKEREEERNEIYRFVFAR